MLWKMLQISVFAGVMATNIEWQWTPNGYVASLVALGAAFTVTYALSILFDGLALLRNRSALLDKQRPQGSGQPGVDVVHPRIGRR
jgi:hypothetical protein